MTTMPAAFIGHGSPMNALERNRYTDAWRAFGASVPKPRAIVVVSAHWYINASAVTSMARPKTIHDFYGFPRELSSVEYPAPGDPALAEEIAEILKPTWIGRDTDSWGIDHGSWSVLVHAFPDADIPVVQLSINASETFDYHLQLGANLAPLRDDRVLILGSGNVVHNLHAIDWGQPDSGFYWAKRFNSAATEIMTSAPSELPGLIGHDDYKLAAPSPDHFIPLLYLAGLASAEDETTKVLVDGYSMGSLSMAAYTLDSAEIESNASNGAPPRPRVPADETNV